MLEVSLPKSFEFMIRESNQKLKEFQRHLWKEISEANEEIMNMLELKKEDGWELDLDRMAYVKTEPTQPPLEESEQPKQED